MAQSLSLTLDRSSSQVLIGNLTGLAAGTVYTINGEDHYAPPSTVFLTGTASGSLATFSTPLSVSGLHYFRGEQVDEWSDIEALWCGESPLQRSDLLSDKLRDILSNNVGGLTAAWTQFATAVGYTLGSIGTANIVVGDRLKPTRNAVTICVVGDKEDVGLTDVAIGAFGQYARRLIRGYVNLVPKNETEQRETERERLRDTLRSAVVDILLNDFYQTVTCADGWRWFNCRPIDSDVGEIIRNNEFVWAFEVVWQAETQGDR